MSRRSSSRPPTTPVCSRQPDTLRFLRRPSCAGARRGQDRSSSPAKERGLRALHLDHPCAPAELATMEEPEQNEQPGRSTDPPGEPSLHQTRCPSTEPELPSTTTPGRSQKTSQMDGPRHRRGPHPRSDTPTWPHPNESRRKINSPPCVRGTDDGATGDVGQMVELVPRSRLTRPRHRRRSQWSSRTGDGEPNRSSQRAPAAVQHRSRARCDQPTQRSCPTSRPAVLETGRAAANRTRGAEASRSRN